MITAIGKIKTILDAIPEATLPHKFKYMQSKPKSFPAACLLSLGAKEQQIDDITNKITESFIIRLIYTADESEEGYTKWMTLVDTVSRALRKRENLTLDGAAINFMIKQIPPPTGVESGYSQPVVIFDIICEAEILININYS